VFIFEKVNTMNDSNNQTNRLVCYTIGHSTHEITSLIKLLQKYGINWVVDVRSIPYSRRNPQYNRENLIPSLKKEGIFYLHMGTELSVNRNDPSLFTHGRIDFDKLITTDYFQNGINIVIDHIKKRLNISLLCAEKDPYRCHRFVLVAYELTQRGIEVKHIREDGRLESQHQLEEKLLQEFEPGYDQGDLFHPPKTRTQALLDAYRKRIIQMLQR
jgi:uncharacterized protein (DUF488 family)